MPVISVWVMPMGILGVLTMPLGFDAVFWRLMGEGVDWMIAVALWVAHLPGAVGYIHAFGSGPLLLASAGLLLLCLLRSPLRLSGAALALAACLWVLATPRPDVLIAGDGGAAAVRGGDGRLAILFSRRDKFALKEWLMADGDGRDIKDKSLAAGIACDAVGCIGHLANGRLASFVTAIEGFEEDCRRAAVVVSPRQAQLPCAAKLIDRKVWRARGSIALRWSGDQFVETDAHPAGYDRPWARGPRAAATSQQPAAQDATPRQQGLEPGD
jgi:competence protein ComEC